MPGRLCDGVRSGNGECRLDDAAAEDAGISGASRHNRPALLELVARIDEWDVLLCFDWSRITRNTEDLGWLKNRVRLHQRQAFETSTGLDLENIGSQVMGVMHEQFLSKLAADTHRGLRGKATKGLNAGGRPYGYRSEDVEGGKRLVIEDDQAEVVREVLPKVVDSTVGVLTRPGSSRSPSVGSHGRRALPNARCDPAPHRTEQGLRV